jgi:pimeloyl-ACP methyl ester carboxylesterase
VTAPLDTTTATAADGSNKNISVQWIEILGVRVGVFVAGSGDPTVVLHRDTGHEWSPFHDALARDRMVIAPALPGFHPSERLDWVRSTNDLAHVTGLILDDLALAPCPIVGLGYGAWIAAELATTRPERVGPLVLHAPMGLLPPEGAYLDQFLIPTLEYLETGFASRAMFDTVCGAFANDDDKPRAWDNDRETLTRVAWAPYLHSKRLPHLLPKVRTPVLVIASELDRIVPQSVPEHYHRLIPDSEFAVIAGVGHRAEFEAADELARLTNDHLVAAQASFHS